MALYEAVENRRAIWGQFAYFNVWLGVTSIGFWLHPSASGHGTHTELGLPPCPSVILFNRPCPGCGLTTSWSAFIHGDFAAAFHAHPLGPALYLFFTVTALMALRAWMGRQRFTVDGPRFNKAMMILAIVYFGFGVWRMAVTPDFRSGIDISAMR